jgi:hypothetical protein
MTFVQKIPGQCIKVILLLGETNGQIVGENVGYFVKAFQSTIIVYDRFGAAEVGTQREAHTVRI